MSKEQFLTSDDVENLVVEQGCPAEMFMCAADFRLAYNVYRQINRDEKGAFILAMNTKIRLKDAGPVDAPVDLSAKAVLGPIHDERQQADIATAKALTGSK